MYRKRTVVFVFITIRAIGYHGLKWLDNRPAITDLSLVNNLTKFTINTKANLANNHNEGFNVGYCNKFFGLLDISYGAGLAYNKYSFDLKMIRQLLNN